MSLLMKALEKAAKDRLDTKAGNAAAAGGTPPGLVTDQATAGATQQAAAVNTTKSELTLEPIVAQGVSPAVTAAPPPPQAARARTPATPNANSAAAPAAVSREPADAAAMVRAGQTRSTGNMAAYLRDQPLVAFGIFATLFVIGYGVYIYMELNPGLFVKVPARPAPGVPLAQPRTPAPNSAPAPAATITGSPVPAPPPPVPLVSLLPSRQETTASEKPAAAPVARRVETRSAGSVAAPVPALPSPAPVPSTPRDAIRVTSGSTTPTINPLLIEAYGALAGGNFDSSRQLYSQVLKGDPGNVEALLGLASISTQQGDRDAATRQYVRILELDPRNTLAQAGLIGIVGRADPLSAETRVKQLIARDPAAAYLHFTLGNTYVDQLRWPDAQQAYFQAFHLQPDNPDYAYNLAVALEHIGQARPALEYYRRAVQLATVKGRANFSIAAAQERAAKLEQVVQ
jgi:Flp pilus assembly protein TadD